MREEEKNVFQFVEESRKEPAKHDIASRKSSFADIYTIPGIQQVQQQAARCLDCGNPYCSWKCPVHNAIPGWLELAREGRITEAAELCHSTNSLPEVCGRVCPQDRLCEGACTLNDGFGAVTIGAVEKYITDTAFAQGWRPSVTCEPTEKRVAVVGAGPAGLACADVLVRNGVQPTVFDSYPEIGGLLTFGIPEFKLEKKIMQRRREIFCDMGITFCLSTTIGEDVAFAELLDNYDAVFLGMGAYRATDGRLGGMQFRGVYPALDFLVANNKRQLALPAGKHSYIPVAGKQVIVLGGGDTAMDCNRTCVRLGAASVQCFYRRDKENMPGSRKEITHAGEEGVLFEFQQQPVAVLGLEGSESGQVSGVRFARTRMSDADENGRCRSETIAGSEYTQPADIVLVAFGFQPSPQGWFAQFDIATHEDGRVQVQQQRNAFQTTNEQVFAGGDMVRGSDLAVTAIAEGRKAANGILQYLNV